MKHLLNISDLNNDDFNSIIKFAENLEYQQEKILKNKQIGLIFEKNSTRTRLSFKVGIKQLDGDYIDINLNELNLNNFESYEDTFEVMSCYLDYLVFRTTDHKKLKLALKHFKKPIINALSDISHPCQAISDIYTLKKKFGIFDNLKIVWMGDMNNVLYSLIEAINFTKNTTIDVFTNKNIFTSKQEIFQISKNVNFHFEINEKIISSANCVMTDVYNSMNDKDNKEEELIKFQVNNQLMNLTNDDTVFMHCLPAKVGSEVTQDVLKGDKSIVMEQAQNRLIAQRGILQWLNT